jgi:hypothetical protein
MCRLIQMETGIVQPDPRRLGRNSRERFHTLTKGTPLSLTGALAHSVFPLFSLIKVFDIKVFDVQTSPCQARLAFAWIRLLSFLPFRTNT